jgi:cell division protein FtsW
LWIRVGGLQIQPGEFAKILLVIFLAGYLRERREVLAAPTRRFLGIGIPALRHALPLLLLCGIALVLLVAMNDLGTSLLFFVIALAMIYIATGRLLYVGAGLGVFALGALGAVQLTSHVQSRIEGWLDPWSVEQTSGYQIAQSIYTIADGGVLGAGFGRGLILNNAGGTIIPYAQTDFIYSVIANELGLVGAIAVILLYLLLSWRGFRIATAADDGFSKLLAAGLATAVAFQVFVIVGGVIRLLPLTGLTLPFVSYGGSSVTANFAIAGLLLCISQRANRERPL